MSQSVTNMMGGMSLGPPSPKPKTRPSATNAGSQQVDPSSSTNRLPPLMKKYMNPAMVRAPNTGLQNLPSASSSSSSAAGIASISAYQEGIRGPLLKLAGVNVPVNPAHHPTSFRSPAKSKQSLTQHTAHGLHGPAHSTTARVHASSVAPLQAKRPDVGKYDGGLETDDARDVHGESAKVLDMDSSASASVMICALSAAGMLIRCEGAERYRYL